MGYSKLLSTKEDMDHNLLQLASEPVTEILTSKFPVETRTSCGTRESLIKPNLIYLMSRIKLNPKVEALQEGTELLQPSTRI